jgi:hypothetical protein
MQASAVRPPFHALAYDLANLSRTLALPNTVERCSLTTLHENVVKTGAKIITHAHYTAFRMARGTGT